MAVFSSLPLLRAFPIHSNFLCNPNPHLYLQTHVSLPRHSPGSSASFLFSTSSLVLSSPQPAVYPQENSLCRRTVIFINKTTGSARLETADTLGAESHCLSCLNRTSDTESGLRSSRNTLLWSKITALPSEYHEYSVR